jgi:enoyl-CoA hydratase/carnithine racemase
MAGIKVSRNGHVATVELDRPPNNFLDMELIGEVAGAFEELDRDDQCRAIVLCSAGKHFCAGANLGQRLAAEAAGKPAASGKHLYHEANRLVRTKTPFVAAVQGAAVGAGLGLALVADFLQRKFCPPGLPSGVRHHAQLASGRRHAEGVMAALHGRAHRRRRGVQDRPD